MGLWVTETRYLRTQLALCEGYLQARLKLDKKLGRSETKTFSIVQQSGLAFVLCVLKCTLAAWTSGHRVQFRISRFE